MSDEWHLAGLVDRRRCTAGRRGWQESTEGDSLLVSSTRSAASLRDGGCRSRMRWSRVVGHLTTGCAQPADPGVGAEGLPEPLAAPVPAGSSGPTWWVLATDAPWRVRHGLLDRSPTTLGQAGHRRPCGVGAEREPPVLAPSRVSTSADRPGRRPTWWPRGRPGWRSSAMPRRPWTRTTSSTCSLPRRRSTSADSSSDGLGQLVEESARTPGSRARAPSIALRRSRAASRPVPPSRIAVRAATQLLERPRCDRAASPDGRAPGRAAPRRHPV